MDSYGSDRSTAADVTQDASVRSTSTIGKARRLNLPLRNAAGELGDLSFALLDG